ncbi:uncharacterized protein LOC116852606 [Odontomachus brunneus]|uniref:uncharacterized protein LOC116852606 n=1 Tax=Odontomachus brunneus TaxID=486640 RepID=UPI0013F19251|nr:uncharacterized protein LOC116852606 [Odontomachus brunneus]
MRANLQIALVAGRIQRLGLELAAEKTETILFYGSRKKPEEFLCVRVLDELVQTKETMKYLGILLDSRLTFRHHLEYAAGKALKMARALGRLMPNLRGPHEARRRLYATNGLLLDGHAASTNTANLHISKRAAKIYQRIRDLKKSERWTPEAEAEIRQGEKALMTRQWCVHLRGRGLAGARVREAIVPSLDDWLGRNHGRMVFHLTQIITGHGCFNDYLNRIAWISQREELRSVVGEDLSLPALVQAIIRDKKGWDAAKFASTVMRAKEESERQRRLERRQSTTACKPPSPGTKEDSPRP